MTARAAVRVVGLRKAFGDKVVLDGIDLEIAEGSVFALLGPNGAGKTTTVQILSTLIRADAGEIQVAGFDVSGEPQSVRDAIGVTGQFSSVDYLLTGRENLMLMADLHHLGRRAGRLRVDELLERFDLVDAAAQMVMKYSGGMRRRLDLAMTLLGEPRIIFLDEPTTGLDPRSRHTMWQITRELVAGGVTFCSPPRTWMRQISSPTASPSSTRGGWSPRGRRISSSDASRVAESGSISVTPPR